MDITLTVSDEEAAAIAEEIAAMPEPRPTLATFLVDTMRHQVVGPIVARQGRYRLDRAVVRVRAILDRLVQLTPEQQDEVQAIAAAAVDARLAANQ